jgi:lipopolysaccharide export system protein LptA
MSEPQTPDSSARGAILTGMTWQLPARIGAILIAVTCGGTVYLTLGTRQAAEVPAAPDRVDPTAAIETTGADLQQLQGLRRDYRIDAERQLTYENGSTRFLGAQVLVENREGRDFLMTGGEAGIGSNGSEFEMIGGVALSSNDGFTLDTERAVFSDETGTVRASGAVSFSRRGLVGTGVGMTYDTDLDILTIESETVVSVTAADGGRIEFTSDMSRFERARQTMALDGDVRIVQGGDILEAEHVNVQLDDRGERATFISLRDSAEVRTSGGGLDSMRAASIDLDYTDDGRGLERVGLSGAGELILTPRPGIDVSRRIRGNSIEVALAVDQTIRTVSAVGEVTLELPAADESSHLVTADALIAQGGTEGLRVASFEGHVVFREYDVRSTSRLATAERLRIDFSDGTVSSAIFLGAASFVDGPVSVSGTEAHYIPGNGALSLRGIPGGTRPTLDNGRLAVEADTIDLLLGMLRIDAIGEVTTTLAASFAEDGSRLPALLESGALVNVRSEAFEYGGTQGTAVYSGTVVLWQGATILRANRLTLDEASGDMRAEGDAQSAFTFDGEASLGLATRIQYNESTRTVTYGEDPQSTEGDTARLTGPQGDLEARAIVVHLSRSGAAVERIEATSAVQLLLGERTAIGDQLTYDANRGEYMIRGIVGTPAVLIYGCRRTEGRSLTFIADSDQVVVDGDDDVRTRTVENPCDELPES